MVKKTYNQLQIAAAESIAISEAVREKSGQLLAQSEITSKATRLALDQVPEVLGTAFNTRFSSFWASQMADAAMEAERQIRGWIQLYIKGIALNLEVFLNAITDPQLQSLVRSHFDEWALAMTSNVLVDPEELTVNQMKDAENHH